MRSADRGLRVVQVGLKSSFMGPHGQLMLFLGNKSPAPLTGVVFAVPPVPQLAFQLGPVPPAIEPKKQARVCAGPRLPRTCAVRALRILHSLCQPWCDTPDAQGAQARWSG